MATDKNREKHKHAVEVLANDFVAGGWHNEVVEGAFEDRFEYLPASVRKEIAERVDEIQRRIDPGSVQIIAAQEFLEDEQ